MSAPCETRSSGNYQIAARGGRFGIYSGRLRVNAGSGTQRGVDCWRMETPQILRLNPVRKPAVVSCDPQQDVPAAGIKHAIRGDPGFVGASTPVLAVVYQTHRATLLRAVQQVWSEIDGSQVGTSTQGRPLTQINGADRDLCHTARHDVRHRAPTRHNRSGHGTLSTAERVRDPNRPKGLGRNSRIASRKNRDGAEFRKERIHEGGCGAA